MSVGTVLFRDRAVTWAEFEDRAARLAGGLRAAGIGSGDRVGYLSRNGPEFYEVMMACARIGAVFVPFNIRLAPASLELLRVIRQQLRSLGREP